MVITRTVGPSLWSLITSEINGRGPIPFSEFQELALYHSPGGFYSSRGSAGRTGDFMTSPEVGELFAHCMSNALDKWWKQLGRPDPFFVIEGGAGTGTLAKGILDTGPRCATSLRYVTVERSAAFRGEQAGHFIIQPPEVVLAPTIDETPVVGNLRGPLVTSMSDLPAGKFTGVVFANELLDNLPVDIFQFRGRSWYRVCVGLGREGLHEVLVPMDEDGDEEIIERVKWLAPGATDGARVPLQTAATEWFSRALDIVDRGRVVIIDYARTTKWMSRHPWDDWMRTYRNHRPGGEPLDSPGTQDITCEVAVDQLAQIRKPDEDHSQTEFLEAFGLVDYVSEARNAWHARAAIGDLGATRARGRVQEGRALTDPNGLGRYRVLEWEIQPRH